ncbi:hypothetical protein CBL_04054 [Carabus blaptoides fortunei]
MSSLAKDIVALAARSNCILDSAPIHKPCRAGDEPGNDAGTNFPGDAVPLNILFPATRDDDRVLEKKPFDKLLGLESEKCYGTEVGIGVDVGSEKALRLSVVLCGAVEANKTNCFSNYAFNKEMRGETGIDSVGREETMKSSYVNKITNDKKTNVETFFV